VLLVAVIARLVLRDVGRVAAAVSSSTLYVSCEACPAGAPSMRPRHARNVLDGSGVL
jgi:hypothetical protein